MNKIEVKPNVDKDDPVLCPICNSIITRIWNDKKNNQVYLACEKGHILEASEVEP